MLQFLFIGTEHCLVIDKDENENEPPAIDSDALDNPELEDMVSRKESLEIQLEELGHLAESLSKAQQTSTQPIELLAIQNGLDNTTERLGKIKLELSTLSLLNASDLYIDTTQIVQ
jgi:hypothetical protein